MGIDAMVSTVIGMKAASVQEQFSMGVTKMAMDRMEQTGAAIEEMMGSGSAAAPVSMDPNLGGYVDIAV